MKVGNYELGVWWKIGNGMVVRNLIEGFDIGFAAVAISMKPISKYNNRQWKFYKPFEICNNIFHSDSISQDELKKEIDEFLLRLNDMAVLL